MQKTFLKFMVFELVERVLRFRLLLNECADALHETAPVLKQALLDEAASLEDSLLAQKSQMNRLFAENTTAKQLPAGLDSFVAETYERLSHLSRTLLQLGHFNVEAETYLFLKDTLPKDLTKAAGEQSVLLTAENNAEKPHPLPGVLFEPLSILQKGNPLAWVGLTRAYSQFLLEHSSTLESLKLDLKKADKKRGKELPTLDDGQIETLLAHALNLRLLGPAYYFQALADAVLTRDEKFLHLVEPALFFGLNHQNFTHKNLVILHEACEKQRSLQENDLPDPLPEDTLANVFRAVEKAIPAKMAFQEKQFERAIQLRERLNDGILLSSTPVYALSDVDDVLRQKRDQADFSIYEPLGMMTEYPHSPREIINAGWLHKMERSAVWLYSALNEADGGGFARVGELVNYQDHLLRKSIEVSEVHRVLLCNA
jgi:hypothetical protein